MFGWFSAASSFASRSNRATLSLSSKKSSGRTLSATARSRRASFARYTSPIPPAPRGERISYGPSRVPEARLIGGNRAGCSWIADGDYGRASIAVGEAAGHVARTTWAAARAPRTSARLSPGRSDPARVTMEKRRRIDREESSPAHSHSRPDVHRARAPGLQQKGDRAAQDGEQDAHRGKAAVPEGAGRGRRRDRRDAVHARRRAEKPRRPARQGAQGRQDLDRRRPGGQDRRRAEARRAEGGDRRDPQLRQGEPREALGPAEAETRLGREGHDARAPRRRAAPRPRGKGSHDRRARGEDAGAGEDDGGAAGRRAGERGEREGKGGRHRGPRDADVDRLRPHRVAERAEEGRPRREERLRAGPRRKLAANGPVRRDALQADRHAQGGGIRRWRRARQGARPLGSPEGQLHARDGGPEGEHADRDRRGAVLELSLIHISEPTR